MKRKLFLKSALIPIAGGWLTACGDGGQASGSNSTASNSSASTNNLNAWAGLATDESTAYLKIRYPEAFEGISPTISRVDFVYTGQYYSTDKKNFSLKVLRDSDNDANLEFKVSTNRHRNDETVKWLNQNGVDAVHRANSRFLADFGEANFAFKGLLTVTFSDNTTQTIDFYLGQSHDLDRNYWIYGGPQMYMQTAERVKYAPRNGSRWIGDPVPVPSFDDTKGFNVFHNQSDAIEVISIEPLSVGKYTPVTNTFYIRVAGDSDAIITRVDFITDPEYAMDKQGAYLASNVSRFPDKPKDLQFDLNQASNESKVPVTWMELKDVTRNKRITSAPNGHPIDTLQIAVSGKLVLNFEGGDQLTTRFVYGYTSNNQYNEQCFVMGGSDMADTIEGSQDLISNSIYSKDGVLKKFKLSSKPLAGQTQTNVFWVHAMPII